MQLLRKVLGMTNSQWLRKRIYDQCGVVVTSTSRSIEELSRTEWSAEFETLMRNRLIQGALRYGVLNDPSKPQWDRVSDMKKRLDLYSEDGNTEHLVDVANLALLEFEEGIHPLKHFSSNDDLIHTKVL